MEWLGIIAGIKAICNLFTVSTEANIRQTTNAIYSMSFQIRSLTSIAPTIVASCRANDIP